MGTVAGKQWEAVPGKYKIFRLFLPFSDCNLLGSGIQVSPLFLWFFEGLETALV